jgi:membrane protein
MPDANHFALSLAGQCRCGEISYQISKTPLFTFVCHCTDCQQLSSSAFSMGMAVPKDSFTLQGEPDCWEKIADRGGWSRQFTCPVCTGWTHTLTENSPGIVIVRPSTLTDHRWLRPVAEIFTRSALPWALLKLPLSFETEFEDTEPLEAAFAETDFSAPPAAPIAEQSGTDHPKGGAPAEDAVRKDRVKVNPGEWEAGRYAEAPHQIPARGWWNVMKRAGAGFIQDRIMAEAASVTFYVLLALFPAIAAFISIYGLFTDPSHVGDELASLGGVIPGGGLQIIQDQITALTSKSHGALGFAAIIGLLVSLWSANNGIKSLIGALNVVYHEHEKRSYVKLTLVAFAFTLGTIVFAMIALFGVVAIPIILNFVGLGFATAILISVLRWPAMMVVVAIALSVIYRYGPSRNWARWRWVSWGGTAAAVFWIVGSLAFSFYVSNFGNYNKTYGSLGAVIGFMTWIWISTIVVLMGAELNAELEQQTEKDSTIGPEKPPGERGAFKADVKI